jgi:hypothetical protein
MNTFANQIVGVFGVQVEDAISNPNKRRNIETNHVKVVNEELERKQKIYCCHGDVEAT